MNDGSGQTDFRCWASYVALGDSFSEGLDDPHEDSRHGYRGWTDRLADHLDAATPGVRYANLAVRGKLLDQVVDDQVPAATELRPALVSLAAGGNDILRPFSDPDALAARFDDAVGALRARGAQVLIGTGFDTRGTVMRHVRGKVATYNSHLWAVASRHDCFVMDLCRCGCCRTRARGAPTGCTSRPTGTGGWLCGRRRCSVSRSTTTGGAPGPRPPSDRGTTSAPRTSAGPVNTWCRGSDAGSRAGPRGTDAPRSARTCRNCDAPVTALEGSLRSRVAALEGGCARTGPG